LKVRRAPTSLSPTPPVRTIRIPLP
jgi:hypothetical protein